MTIRPAQAAIGFGRGPPEDLCLGFANTRYWRGTDTPTEELLAPTDLLRWCAASGLDQGTLERISSRWAAEPAIANAALEQAIRLREAMYRAFAAGGAADAADVATLNDSLGASVARSRLLTTPDGLAWAVPEGEKVEMLLAPVLWSAGDLLAGRRLARVRRCANDKCVWLFLDESKAGTRRWCMMSACGNRAKAHRHYAKVRAKREGDA
jgi:predicted RNA-binding Zn ribbon-like protein